MLIPRNFLPLAIALLAAVPLSGQTANHTPLTLLKTTYMPEIVGDFDHFAVDLKRNHLFVSAEVHHSIEVFNLKTGEHLQSVGGLQTPHSVAFDVPKDELLVADGGDSAVIALAAEDFHRISRTQLVQGVDGGSDSPDAAFYDQKTHLYYIGNGGESAKLEESTISIFSPAEGKIIDNIKVPGNNLESMLVDDTKHRLYVNVRDRKQIAVVDLNTKQVVNTWTVPGMNKNTAMSMDAATGRLFVAGRNPAILYVLDVNTGHVVTQVPCVEINDDMTWDPVMKRLYVSGSQGLSVFHQDSADRYTEVARLPTNGGKTSTYVPSTRQFYVVHPKTSIDAAGLLVYAVNQ